jgi:hypothetical protein
MRRQRKTRRTIRTEGPPDSGTDTAALCVLLDILLFRECQVPICLYAARQLLGDLAVLSRLARHSPRKPLILLASLAPVWLWLQHPLNCGRANRHLQRQVPETT